jgi:hypothetical protein
MDAKASRPQKGLKLGRICLATRDTLAKCVAGSEGYNGRGMSNSNRGRYECNNGESDEKRAAHDDPLSRKSEASDPSS